LLEEVFSYHKDFYVIVYDYFAGTKDTDYVMETDGAINLEVYDSLGYHLIDSNDVDYGEISDITYSGTSFITVPVLVPASGSFAIVKYYQSLITSPPTKSISSKDMAS